MTRWEFLVCPSQNDALVLDQVKKIPCVVLIAQGKGTALMGLDESFFLSECHMCILIEQGLEHLRRGRR